MLQHGIGQILKGIKGTVLNAFDKGTKESCWVGQESFYWDVVESGEVLCRGLVVVSAAGTVTTVRVGVGMRV